MKKGENWHSGCASCKQGKDEVLTSVAVDGQSMGVCEKCLKKPRYAQAVKRD